MHRLSHEKRGSVYALPEELDAWWNARGRQVEAGIAGGTPEPGATLQRPGLRRTQVTLVAMLSTAFAVLLFLKVSHWLSPAVSPPRIVPLTSYPGTEDNATFSPDGSRIAFSWQPDDGSAVGVYTQVIGASGSPLQLAANAFVPAWSPDGRFVSFLRQTSSGTGVSLFLIPALGGPERKLAVFELPRFASLCPVQAWTPDGNWIVVPDRADHEGPFALTAISVATGERKRLTNPPSGVIGDSAPAISSDGKELAFVRSSGPLVEDVFLQVLAVEAVDKPAPRRITGLGWHILDLLRDGRELLFTADHEGAKRLWRISIDRLGPPVLVEGIGPVGAHLALSLKGDRLAYSDLRGYPDIWRQDIPEVAHTARPASRLIASTRSQWNARISPDGRKIAFASDRTGSFEIWVSDASGNHPMQLTSFGGPVNGTPRWSPDSSRIAFDTRVNGNADIYVVNAEGGQPRRFTKGSSENAVPSWSHDGLWIYFISNRSGQNQLWKMPAAGGQAIELSQGGAADALESPDGRFVYLARAPGITSLWRVPASGGAEEKILDGIFLALTFDVTNKGIYYVRQRTSTEARQGVEFFSFASHTREWVVSIDRPLHFGLSISPDEKWLAFAALKQNSGDLMMVDRFR